MKQPEFRSAHAMRRAHRGEATGSSGWCVDADGAPGAASPSRSLVVPVSLVRARSGAPPTALHEQVAAAVAAAAGTDDVAFVLEPDAVSWASGPRHAWSPETATSRLVQGLYERHGTRAARRLRRPVWSVRPADPFGAGLVKVHGKRLYQVTPRDHGLTTPPLVEVPWAFTAPPLLTALPARLPLDDPGAVFAAAQRLLDDPARATAPAPRWASDRRVGALLVDREGALLGAAVNTHGRNRTLHAEVNLVLGHVLRARAPLPAGCVVFATLRPCRACAGLLWAAAADPASLRVVFAEDDPGPGARNTVLCHGSEARRRFARTPGEHAARCLARHEAGPSGSPRRPAVPG